jgi:predicted amidohydrolase
MVPAAKLPDVPNVVILGLVQTGCTADANVNLSNALRRVAEAARRGAHIVCLPELFRHRYFCQYPGDSRAFAHAEPVPGPTTELLAAAARQHGVVLVGGSLFERAPDGRFFNTAPVFGPDGALLGTYRKSHIPEDPLYHEQGYFTPGDQGVGVFATPFGRVGVLICYDQWFPEAARSAVLRGAEVLLCPTAIGTIDEAAEPNITGDWRVMWRATQVGHAAANNIYMAAVNRVGREGRLDFWGGSFLAGPTGQICAEANGHEEVLLAPCDLRAAAALREAWGFFRNRRPDLYNLLSQP